MEPATIALLIGAGSQIAASIAAYYQNAKARGENEKILKQIQEQWNAIVPPDYSASIEDPPELIADLPPPPNLDYSAITPQMYEMVGQYKPEVAQYIAEANPELVKYSETGKEGQSAMLDALREFKRISSQDNDPVLMDRLRRAQNDAMGASQSRSQSVQQDFARRGQLGSTQQLAAQIAAGEGQINRMADLESQALAEAYKNKLAALTNSSNIGNQVAGQDLDLASKNASIINSFNQRTATNRQAYANNAANAANAAQLTNLQNNQNIANKNVDVSNSFAKSNRDMANEGKIQDTKYRMGQIEFANNMANQNWDNRLKQTTLNNDNKQNTFQNLITLLKGRTDPLRDQMANNVNNARGQAQIYEALGGAGSQAANAYFKYGDKKPTSTTTTTIPTDQDWYDYSTNKKVKNYEDEEEYN